MISQQMTPNGIFPSKKTAHVHDDVISFDVNARRKISKLCPPPVNWYPRSPWKLPRVSSDQLTGHSGEITFYMITLEYRINGGEDEMMGGSNNRGEVRKTGYNHFSY